jgi:hypothetical protein
MATDTNGKNPKIPARYKWETLILLATGFALLSSDNLTYEWVKINEAAKNLLNACDETSIKRKTEVGMPGKSLMAERARNFIAKINTTPITPYVPNLLSFIISRIFSFVQPPPKPSQTSANPSSWKAPVLRIEAAIDNTIAIEESKKRSKIKNTTAATPPTIHPTKGKYFVA